MGRWEGPKVIGGSFLELKVAGPSMLGIGRPDRHALPRITSSKMRQPRRVLPSRASGFVLRRDAADGNPSRNGSVRVEIGPSSMLGSR